MQFPFSWRLTATSCLVSILSSCHGSSSGGAANELPRIVSSPPLSAMLGKPFSYQVTAFDPDLSGSLQYQLQRGGPGAAIDDLSGLLTWTPSIEGSFDFEVVVVDARGGGTLQLFTVEVTSRPTRLERTSPLNGEQAVALTRETILEFDRPIDPFSLEAEDVLTTSAGEDLSSRLLVSPDKRKLTIFYDEPLPLSAVVRVLIDADEICSRSRVGSVDAVG